MKKMFALVFVTLLGSGCSLAELRPVSFSTDQTEAGMSVAVPETSSEECERALVRQKEDLVNDNLAVTETFEKHRVATTMKARPADLDISSNRLANMFRTKIRNELIAQGVNFAGHYSVVDVPMTGWGSNYFIIDRTNGHAYTFPYVAVFLDIKNDSNLLIMNSKTQIENAISENGSDYACAGSAPRELVGLRPVYFLWKDNKLEKIGPVNITPKENNFWRDN